MYAGHFAAGLALKAAEPRAPTWGLMVGVGLLDLAFGVLVIAGQEGGKPGGGLDIPWSHSLVMACCWAAAFALPFWRRGYRVVAFLGVAVLSHWILDIFVHPPELGLWPGSGVQLGWVSVFGGNAGWFEIIVTLAGGGFFGWKARHSPLHGRYWPLSCGVLALCLGLESLAA